MTSPTVVFFDGLCNLCNGFVNRLVRLDHGGRLRFASLQGKTARELLGAEANALASLVVIRDGEIFRESAAIIQIGLSLGGVHGLGALVLRLLPRVLTDFAYRLIARYRYQIFGKREFCRLPTEAERTRFLD